MVKLTTLFAGKIVLLELFPHHLEICCDNPDHTIIDTAGNPVNMINYTLAFSKYIGSSPGLSHERLHYFEYPAVFDEDFSKDNLDDGVHLNNGAYNTDLIRVRCHNQTQLANIKILKNLQI